MHSPYSNRTKTYEEKQRLKVFKSDWIQRQAIGDMLPIIYI
jgi:hypothetical protein